MRSQLPVLLSIILVQLLSYRISASRALGKIQITVQSNDTLSLITEFNHTNAHIRAHPHAHEANVTVEELIASQLVLEFDVCFPDHYCPVVVSNIDQFESKFL
jgi:kynurenine formamidase